MTAVMTSGADSEKSLQFSKSLKEPIRITATKTSAGAVAYGGMANIPKRAINCEKILLNSTLSENIINKAKKSLEKDFKPITDARASQKYRMEIAKNLLEKCFLEIKQKKLIRINI